MYITQIAQITSITFGYYCVLRYVRNGAIIIIARRETKGGNMIIKIQIEITRSPKRSPKNRKPPTPKPEAICKNTINIHPNK